MSGAAALPADRARKPDLVAEIEFAEWTSDNVLRHPSFKGLREDKGPEADPPRRAGGRVIGLRHLGDPLFGAQRL